MKIMLLADAGSIHAVRWANAFCERGNEVIFVADRDHVPEQDGLLNGVKLCFLPFGGTKAYFLNAPFLHRIWKKYRPDVVNVHYASGYGTLARLARIKPCVLNVWGSDVYEFPYQSRLKMQLLLKNLRYADALASTSCAMGRQVKKLLKSEDMQLRITPFGVDTEKFSPEGPAAAKPEGSFVFGCVKSLSYIYGIDLLIKAFSIFLDKWRAEGSVGPEPRMFICGRGDNKEDFIKLRNELGLKDLIDIEDYIANERVPAVLRSFDAVCLGSLEESFGVAAIEAMACGVAVIASDTEGFKEVIEDNVSGLITPGKNPRTMAEKMWQLYKRKELRARLSEAGRARVMKEYSWNDNVQLLLKLLEDTAAGKGQGR